MGQLALQAKVECCGGKSHDFIAKLDCCGGKSDDFAGLTPRYARPSASVAAAAPQTPVVAKRRACGCSRGTSDEYNALTPRFERYEGPPGGEAATAASVEVEDAVLRGHVWDEAAADFPATSLSPTVLTALNLQTSTPERYWKETALTARTVSYHEDSRCLEIASVLDLTTDCETDSDESSLPEGVEQHKMDMPVEKFRLTPRSPYRRLPEGVELHRLASETEVYRLTPRAPLPAWARRGSQRQLPMRRCHSSG